MKRRTGFRVPGKTERGWMIPHTGDAEPPRMDMEPIVEIYTTDDDLTVAVDLPGFEEEEIQLRFISGTLTIIAGESRVTVLALPPVDPDSMESRYRHGVLEVRFSRGRPIRID